MSLKNQFTFVSKNFLILLLIVLSVGIVHQMMLTSLPLYIQDKGANAFYAGLMTGIMTITSLLIRPITGFILDKFQHKWVCLIGLGVILACVFSYMVLPFLWMILIMRAVHGIGFALSSTASSTMVTDYVDDDRLVEGIGYYGIANSIAQAIAPGIGLYIIDHLGFTSLFLFTTGLGIVSIILTFGLDKQRKIERETKVTQSKSLNKHLVILSLAMMLIAFAQGSIASFLPTYAMNKQLGNISLYFTINAIFLMLSRYLNGRIVARKNLQFVITTGVVLLCIALLLIIFAQNIMVLYLAAACYGSGYGLVQPAINAIIVTGVDVDNRGKANALFLSSLDAGYGISSILWGVLAIQFGYASIYIGAIISVCFGYLLYRQYYQNRVIL